MLTALAGCGGGSEPTKAAEEPSDPACKATAPATLAGITKTLTGGTPKETYTVASTETPGLNVVALRVKDSGAARAGTGIAVWAQYEGKLYSADGLSLQLSPSLPNTNDNPKLGAVAYDSASTTAIGCVKAAAE